MQQVVSAIMGTTPTGLPRNSGRSCCSTEAKYELRSTKSQFRQGAPSVSFVAGEILVSNNWSASAPSSDEVAGTGLGPVVIELYFRFLFSLTQVQWRAAFADFGWYT